MKLGVETDNWYVKLMRVSQTNASADLTDS